MISDDYTEAIELLEQYYRHSNEKARIFSCILKLKAERKKTERAERITSVGH